jgi:hypothetical protein
MKKEIISVSDINNTESHVKPAAKPAVMYIEDYVRTEFATFEEKPFSDVDALVFAQFAYTRLNDKDYSFTPTAAPVLIKDTYRAENFDFMYNNIPKYEKNIQLVTALAASPRFRNIRILDYKDIYDNNLILQFSAMTFEMNDGFLVAFRGTDSTFTGWKEDFCMTFMDSVPAQDEACLYLQSMAEKFGGSIRICGHSKGGNLSMYAALNCDKQTRDRIISVHDLDGPGFKDPEKYVNEYSEIADKVVKIMPESSIVGLLLDGADEDIKIVESSGIGIMQHLSFTWKIKNGEFVEGKKISDIAKNIDKTISVWLKGISHEDREAFIDNLFKVLISSGVRTFAELSSVGAKQLAAMYEAAKDLPEDVKKNATKIIKSLFETSIKTLRSEN